MSLERKKVLLYLHPELYAQDRLAEQYLATLPSGVRGEFCRQSLVAGAALASLDPRLVQLISVMYSENFSPAQLMGLLEQVLGKPESAPTAPPAPAPAASPEAATYQQALANLNKLRF